MSTHKEKERRSKRHNALFYGAGEGIRPFQNFIHPCQALPDSAPVGLFSVLEKVNNKIDRKSIELHFFAAKTVT